MMKKINSLFLNIKIFSMSTTRHYLANDTICLEISVGEPDPDPELLISDPDPDFLTKMI